MLEGRKKTKIKNHTYSSLNTQLSVFSCYSSHYLMDQTWQPVLFHYKRFGARRPPIHGKKCHC